MLNLMLLQQMPHPPPGLPLEEVVSQFFFCHPEFISGSRNALILLDAETSSA
jgi:hypothetical protein